MVNGKIPLQGSANPLVCARELERSKQHGSVLGFRKEKGPKVEVTSWPSIKRLELALKKSSMLTLMEYHLFLQRSYSLALPFSLRAVSAW